MSIKQEKITVEKMIRLYCRLNHKTKDLCVSCAEINAYAQQRLDNCTFKDAKPTCKKCPIHCYSSDKREEIRKIMRFSGPRILLYHPRTFLRHLLK